MQLLERISFCRHLQNCQHKSCSFCVIQGRSQPHSPGWARVPLSSFFPQILINLSYFSSNFTHFLPHFGSPGGRLDHPGRPWLRHWCYPASQSRVGKGSTLLIFSSNFNQFFLKLYLFSSSFWPSGWATRPPGKALATPLVAPLPPPQKNVCFNI